jgi:hypothetical protein
LGRNGLALAQTGIARRLAGLAVGPGLEILDAIDYELRRELLVGRSIAT